MQASVTMALKLLASLSYRVRIRRFSLSQLNTFDHVTLFILRPVEQPRQAWSRFAMPIAQGNDRLHAIALLATRVGHFSQSDFSEKTPSSVLCPRQHSATSSVSLLAYVFMRQTLSQLP